MERATSMEEVRATKVVKSEGCQESKDGVQLFEERQTLSISISTPGSSIDEKFKTLANAFDRDDDQARPKIRRVPFILRDHKDFEKSYEPRVVAIGPLHHGKTRLQFAEKLKLKLAAWFIEENRLVKEVEYNKIKTQIQNLRKWYDETEINNFNDEDLAWMLFVDGCAVLQFIHCYEKDRHQGTLSLNEQQIKNDHVAFAHQDLFLLENQLPYEVLKLLIPTNSSPNSKASNLYMQSIKTFIGFPEKNPSNEWKPIHLLDLMRTKMLGLDPSKPSSCQQSQIDQSSNQPMRDPNPKKSTDTSFRNVKELKVVGIKLQPKLGHTSDIAIEFHSRFCGAIGILELPSLTVDDATEPKLKNLVAYEMCPDFFNDFGITSYVCFIDSLIDEPADVKEMREAGTLRNVLGSDEEVAELFNRISTDLVPNPNTYKAVKWKIQSHYNNVVKTWIAQGVHDHFSSPWTFLAFFGAIIALVLSFIQTWYTIP